MTDEELKPLSDDQLAYYAAIIGEPGRIVHLAPVDMRLLTGEIRRLRAENRKLLDSNEELQQERSMQPGLAFEVSELRAENRKLVEACVDADAYIRGKLLSRDDVLLRLRAAIEGSE